MTRFLPVLLLGACGTSGGGPTWHTDVKPIVYEHCVSCHQSDQIGPFPLATYEDVEPRGVSMLAAILTGEMPPFGAVSDGTCGDFADVRGLEAEQITTIAEWIDAGMPEGREREELPIPDADTIEDPDLTVDFGFDYVPAPTGSHPEDDYRCFLLDPGLDEDQYITAFEVEPGDAEMVHHVILWSIADEDAEARAEDLAGTEGSYTCFGDAGLGGDSTPMATWAPGSGVVHYPEDTGVELEAGRKMIMQVHYHLLPESRSDRTKVHLQLESSVQNPAITYLLADGRVNLPPGQQRAHAGFAYSLSQIGVPIGVNLWGVLPHLHNRGVQITMHVEDTCLVNVPDWDFQWQQQYFYNEPVRIEPDDVISVDCWYDTTDDTENVYWGDGTNDEMCLVGVYVTL